MNSSTWVGQHRLTPEMSSRRLQVLAFVQDYIAAHNDSPSLSEIASGCGIGRARAHQLVKALVRQKHLSRRPGPRGLMLPSAIEEAKRQLREAGYRIDEDFVRVDPVAPYTDSRLLPIAPLDYVAGADGGAGDGKRGKSASA